MLYNRERIFRFIQLNENERLWMIHQFVENTFAYESILEIKEHLAYFLYFKMYSIVKKKNHILLISRIVIFLFEIILFRNYDKNNLIIYLFVIKLVIFVL